MPAFFNLSGDEHDDRIMVIFTLGHTVLRAPSHRLTEALEVIAGAPDASTCSNYMVRHRLYGLWDDDGQPRPRPDSVLKVQTNRATWLLGLIWAGLMAADPDRYDRFGAIATAALERLPQGASAHETWTALSHWLAEVQPTATTQCRADFVVWLEEYLTDPQRSFRLVDADPDAALAALQSGRTLPDTPQLRGLLSSFLFDWLEEQNCFYDNVTLGSVTDHLRSQLIGQPATV